MMDAASTANTGAMAASGFAAAFGRRPDAVFSAPGRVNLIGEHTDYNEGFVLPAAIDRRIYLAVGHRGDESIRAVAGDLADAESHWRTDGDEPIARDAAELWANYLRGVSEQFRRRGRRIGGWDVYIRSDIPLGAGLSSSAALCASFAYALADLNRLDVAIDELASWCQAAEHEYLDQRCGIMDQLAALAGIERHALLIDCRSLVREPVPLPQDAAIVVIDSGQAHQHAGGRYNERRAECEQAVAALDRPSLRDVSAAELDAAAPRMSGTAFKRARHVLTENARTLAMREALAAADYAAIGPLMAESHASMRDDFEISTRQIDALVEIVAQRLDGEGGARLTGGGFGGSVVVLAPALVAERIDRALLDLYRRQTGLEPELYRCVAAAGARRE